MHELLKNLSELPELATFGAYALLRKHVLPRRLRSHRPR